MLSWADISGATLFLTRLQLSSLKFHWINGTRDWDKWWYDTTNKKLETNRRNWLILNSIGLIWWISSVWLIKFTQKWHSRNNSFLFKWRRHSTRSKNLWLSEILLYSASPMLHRAPNLIRGLENVHKNHQIEATNANTGRVLESEKYHAIIEVFHLQIIFCPLFFRLWSLSLFHFVIFEFSEHKIANYEKKEQINDKNGKKNVKMGKMFK